jgi:hypothetical protein
MKKILSWGIYFLVCGTVITAAIVAGKNHGHCHECEIAFGKKDSIKELAHWDRFILRDEEK